MDNDNGEVFGVITDDKGRQFLAADEPLPICFVCGEVIPGISIHGEHGHICAPCVAECAEILRDNNLKHQGMANPYRKPNVYASIVVNKGDL